MTAYLELVMLGGLSKGQQVLIHAGASGVGQSLLTMCHMESLTSECDFTSVVHTSSTSVSAQRFLSLKDCFPSLSFIDSWQAQA